MPSDSSGFLPELLRFIDNSPTCFHAVRSCVASLQDKGFLPLDERDVWQLSAGDRRYVTRNDGALIAFVVGHESPCLAGFHIIGAHTDSPHPRLKPKASLVKHGYTQLAVEPYGGMLLSTWLDRDLSIAGRVLLSEREKPEAIRSFLVDLQRPLLRIPTLAVHLDREVNAKGLVVNQQQHLPPILGLASAEGLDATRLQSLLCDALASECGRVVDPQEILGWDLSLYDTQRATLAGDGSAFVLASRIDNLASCHAALCALLASMDAASCASATRMICFWDHEECGSRSMQGAAGPFIRQVLERIVDALEPAQKQAFHRAMASSFLISADMAHALHPNYADRHEPGHQPIMGKGPVIKTNSNQSYASDAASSARFTALCRQEGFEPQRYVVRSDLPCGSTIGPLTAALLGIATVDVGNPMLSMHSVREMAGAADHLTMTRVMTRFFAQGS